MSNTNSPNTGTSDFAMVDESTIATAADSSTVTSFVAVPGAIDTLPALAVKTTPRNESIGRDAKQDVTQLCVTLTARDLPVDDDSVRAPVDIVVALDISSSMMGPKIDLCKTTLELLLRVLQSSDRFGLVVYSSGARVAIPAQRMTDRNKKSCLRTIQAIQAGGCTCISAALELAYKQMNKIEEPNEVRAVFLLTDGQANQGITSHYGLVSLVQNTFGRSGSPSSIEVEDGMALEDSKATSGGPMTLQCFGYGNDHNSNLLSALARATTGGSYYYVEDDKNVGTAFGDAMGGILSVVAQNVSVTLSIPNDSKRMGVAIHQVFHDDIIQRENGSMTVNMGDFYAEESRDLLLEVKLASLEKKEEEGTNNKIPHVNVSVAYTDTIQKQPATCMPVNCCIERPLGNSVSQDDKHVNAQWLRHSATRAMDQASKLAKEDKLDEAKALLRANVANLQRAYDQLRGSCDSNDDDTMIFLQQLQKDVKDVMQSFENRETHKAYGIHRSMQMCHQYTAQRGMTSRSCDAEDMSLDWLRSPGNNLSGSAGYKMSKSKVACRKKMNISKK